MISVQIPIVLEIIAKCGSVVEYLKSANGEYHTISAIQEVYSLTKNKFDTTNLNYQIQLRQSDW